MAQEGLDTPKDETSCLGLMLSARHVNACALESWYGRMTKKRRGAEMLDNFETHAIESSSGMITMASAWLELSDEFVNYLGSDGIMLPRAPDGNPAALRPCDPRRPVQRDTIDDDSDDEFDSGDDENLESICFPELEGAIEDLLARFQSQVFAKLNWTAPRDAFGSLKVSSPGEIFLLLKSSDFVQHDLSHVYDNCYDKQAHRDKNLKPKLVLRRWCNLDKSMEFRCFCVKKHLVAIVQRYAQTFHEYLLPDCQIGSKIVPAVSAFFQDFNIAAGPSDSIENFVFDVYIDKGNKVWLVDFGPLPEFVSLDTQDTLKWTGEHQTCSNELLGSQPHELLSWQALHKLALDATMNANPMKPQVPAYFCVQSRVQANETGNVIGAHRVPIELVTGELTQDIIDQAKAQLEQNFGT